VRVKEHPAAAPLGVFTVAAVAIAWVLLLVLLWGNDADEALERAWGVAAIAALASSHASVVLRATRATDTPAISALSTCSIALGTLVAAAAALATVEAFELDEDDPAVRVLAIAVVLLLLTTTLPVVLRRLSPPRTAAARPAALERLADEVVAATERIEQLDDRDAVRAECRRLRELARSHGG
jgi:O-antigen/teichoic acid export membrane protein